MGRFGLQVWTASLAHPHAHPRGTLSALSGHPVLPGHSIACEERMAGLLWLASLHMAQARWGIWLLLLGCLWYYCYLLGYPSPTEVLPLLTASGLVALAFFFISQSLSIQAAYPSLHSSTLGSGRLLISTECHADSEL